MSGTSNQLKDLLELAAKAGELSDRLAKAESELASQSAPLGAAKSSQDAALSALASAVEGIKALNFHVIDKNMGDLRTRMDAAIEQATKLINNLAQKVANTQAQIDAAKEDTAKKLEQTEAQRTELTQKRESDARDFAQRIETVSQDLTKRLTELAAQVQVSARDGIRPSGPWSGGKTCDKGDLVSLNGSSYISLVNGNTEKPSKNSKKWQLVAARGGGGGSSGGTGGGIEEAPQDGTPYLRQDAGWVAASSSFDLAAEIHGATGKTTPADNDEVGASDSAASYALKKFTWANIKATLKTYFDAIYAFAANPTFTGTITVTGTGGAVLNNDSASAGAISSTGGGQIDITAPIQLSGNVKDSAGSTGTSGYTLKTNGSGALTYSPNLGCYTLQFVAGTLTTVNDATTYYLGFQSGVALGTNQGRFRVYVPKAGTIKAAELMSYASTAGSNENWTWSVAVNNGTPVDIQTVGTSATLRRWTNTGLSIAVAAGDYLELVTTTPTWVSANPASLNMMGTVYIETTL